MMNQSKRMSLSQKLLTSKSRQQPHLWIKRRVSTMNKDGLEKRLGSIQLISNENRSKRRLKKLAKLVIICSRWCSWATRSYKINLHKYMSFAHITESTKFREDVHYDFLQQLNAEKRRAQMNSPELQDTKRLIEEGRIRAEMMNFNVDYFKPKKRLNTTITNERLKSILSIENVKRRSRKEVILIEKTIKHIQHLKFLNDLPSVMRTRFIECCWLEEYEPKRVIVNQGRKPEFFYVLVHGSLMCTYREESNPKIETICQLEDGMCFGEISLLDNSVNTVILSTRESSQLLVLDKQDFLSIFYSSDKVLSSEEITDRSKNITEEEDDDDENMVEWLKKVSFLKDWPFESLSAEERAEIQLHRILRSRVVTESTKASRFIYIVRSGAISVWIKPFGVDPIDSVRTANENNTDEEAITKSLSYFPENSILENHHYENVKKHGYYNKASFRSSRLMSWKVDNEQFFERLNKFNTPRGDDDSSSLPVIITPRQQNPVKSTLKLRKHFKLPPLNLLKDKNPTHPINYKYFDYINKKKKKLEAMRKAKHVMNLEETIGEEKESLLKVRTLFKGDYCGLNELIFESQPSLELISSGCECVLFPKSLFVKYSSIERMEELRRNEKSYPDFETIQFTIRKQSEWKSFRQNVLMCGLESLESSRASFF